MLVIISIVIVTIAVLALSMVVVVVLWVIVIITIEWIIIIVVMLIWVERFVIVVAKIIGIIEVTAVAGTTAVWMMDLLGWMKLIIIRITVSCSKILIVIIILERCIVETATIRMMTTAVVRR